MATIITAPSDIWNTIVISGPRHRRLLASADFMDVLLVSHAAKWMYQLTPPELSKLFICYN